VVVQLDNHLLHQTQVPQLRNRVHCGVSEACSASTTAFVSYYSPRPDLSEEVARENDVVFDSGQNTNRSISVPPITYTVSR
jgi:hypothetical protein